jgi:hypothetical protein
VEQESNVDNSPHAHINATATLSFCLDDLVVEDSLAFVFDRTVAAGLFQSSRMSLKIEG